MPHGAPCHTAPACHTHLAIAHGTKTAPTRPLPFPVSPQVGAVVLLDSCQYVPHCPTDVQALGCDFLVASGEAGSRTCRCCCRCHTRPVLQVHPYNTSSLPVVPLLPQRLLPCTLGRRGCALITSLPAPAPQATRCWRRQPAGSCGAGVCEGNALCSWPCHSGMTSSAHATTEQDALQACTTSADAACHLQTLGQPPTGRY